MLRMSAMQRIPTFNFFVVYVLWQLRTSEERRMFIGCARGYNSLKRNRIRSQIRG